MATDLNAAINGGCAGGPRASAIKADKLVTLPRGTGDGGGIQDVFFSQRKSIFFFHFGQTMQDSVGVLVLASKGINKE